VLGSITFISILLSVVYLRKYKKNPNHDNHHHHHPNHVNLKNLQRDEDVNDADQEISF
jgi:hypothetical protein